MSATVVPGELDTTRGPPLRIPLAHFLVGLALLVPAAALWLAAATDVVPATAVLARRHLFLTGWVCVTIMGAMTQFVPVWSGVPLYSRRLARLQLWLVVAGLVGMACCFLTGLVAAVWLAGVAVLVGFWTFAYNMTRTLATARPLDVTETHFAFALGCLLAATLAGVWLAVGLAAPATRVVGVPRLTLRHAHVTLAVFGVIVSTVFGALYQLAPMFAVTDLDGLDGRLQRLETIGYPVGVLFLAGGRLGGVDWAARVGAVGVVVGVLAVSIVLARTLARGQAAASPTTRRYVVVVPALGAWLALAAPTWLADPFAPTATLGGPAAAVALSVGVLGFVVSGTLYHVVPFLVWLDQYSDRLGLADVPTVEDLFDGRLAAADAAGFAVGAGFLTATPYVPAPLAGLFRSVGSGALLVGACLLAVNLLLVVEHHADGGVAGLVRSSQSDDAGPDETSRSPAGPID
jgi:hypothetical protein